MFRLFKKKEEEVVLPIVKQTSLTERVEVFINNFLLANQIKPELVAINKVLVKNVAGGLNVEISAKFPGPILGRKGSTIKLLSNGLSKTLDRKVRVEVIV
jgi:ribosomal protein S3